MNEQNANNLNQNSAATVPVTTPVPATSAPVQVAVQSAAAVQPTVAQPVTAAPVQVQATTPVQPQVVPQPAAAAPVQPQVVPQPATAAPVVPQPVAQPTTDASIIPDVAPQQAAPAAPVGQAISAGAALNPIANNPEPQMQAAPVPQATTAPTFAPSAPLQTNMDTNVGFVAVGENLKKKKNVPLIITIVLVLLVGLGCLGYFVIFPMIVKKNTKPIDVYSSVIDQTFKGLNTMTTTIAHNKAIYDIDLDIDTNIESLKDLTGYKYSANFGIDPENKNLQAGLKIKDSDSQEHSAYIYVKGEREYLRLSSYRDLIFFDSGQDYTELWNEAYEIFDDINEDDANYLVTQMATLLKSSLVQSKLTKEDASITVNGKTYKVLNSKYTIDNDTLTQMEKSIIDGINNDDKLLEIIAKNSGMEVSAINEALNNIDTSTKLLEDDQVYYINLYTYSTKNTLIGASFVNGKNNNTLHYYTVNDYFEIVLTGTEEDEETGKDVDINYSAIGQKVDGKTNVSIKNGDEEVASLVISTWDENTKDFSYSINIGESKVTGNIKLVIDTNEERSKMDFSGSVNIDSTYLKVNLSVNNDWTSDVANINPVDAKQLSDEELQAKLTEFSQSLKDTPLYKIFASVSGDIDSSVIDYRLDDTSNALDTDNSTEADTNTDVISEN